MPNNSAVLFRFFILFLFVSSSEAKSYPEDSLTENPFLPMLKQPYAEYARELHEWAYKLDFQMEQPQADTLMMYMWQAAEVADHPRWKLEARQLEITYRFRYKTRMDADNTYNIDSVMVGYAALARDALAAGDTLIYLRVHRDIMNGYYYFIKDYARAFDTAHWLQKELARIPADSMPDKLRAYNDMVNMYYTFRDYEEAGQLLRTMAAEPVVANRLYLLRNVYNSMGLIYSKHYNNPDSAEAYFRKILDLAPEGDEPPQHLMAWEGIAKGNLGRLYAAAGRFDEAIPLVEFSCHRMAEVEDYAFAAGMATLLADIYLNRATSQPGQTSVKSAKRYIDLANKYVDQTYLKRQQPDLFEAMARYYVITGNTQMAVACMDSANCTREAYNREFDAMELKRAEQRAHQQERLVKEELLQAEQSRAGRLQRSVTIAAVWLALVSVLLVCIFMLYRHKRLEYRLLVKKYIPHTLPEEKVEGDISNTNHTHQKLLSKFNQVIDEDKLFLQKNLRVDDVTTLISTNRTYISRLLKEEYNCNFWQFINQKRIEYAKEQALLNSAFSAEALAEMCGFSHTAAFSRAFRECEGVTFREWQEKLR